MDEVDWLCRCVLTYKKGQHIITFHSDSSPWGVQASGRARQSQTCKTVTYQVYGAAHDGSHHPGHGAGYRAFDAADPSVCVDVTGGLDDGVRAQTHPIHKKLIHQSGRESFLQGGKSVHFADGVEGVEDVAIVDLVGASALELALELHSSFDNLQGVGEQTRATRRHSAEQEIHRDGVTTTSCARVEMN